MKTSARGTPDNITRWSSAEQAASSFTALIDAKLEGDRRVQRLTARVRDLAAQLAAAEEQSRRALAQDLHDETGASLAAVHLALARAAHWLPADAPAACIDALNHARGSLADVVESCHRIVEGLNEPSFGAGVAAALANWTEAFGARTAILIDFTCQSDARLDHLPHALALALFRVMQEALGNVARHAHAARVSVSISLDAQTVTLVIEDDGIGIHPLARRKSGRFGLSGMRSRCEALGGSLRVAASRHGGTRVRARLPLDDRSRRVLRAVNA